MSTSAAQSTAHCANPLLGPGTCTESLEALWHSATVPLVTRCDNRRSMIFRCLETAGWPFLKVQEAMSRTFLRLNLCHIAESVSKYGVFPWQRTIESGKDWCIGISFLNLLCLKPPTSQTPLVPSSWTRPNWLLNVPKCLRRIWWWVAQECKSPRATTPRPHCNTLCVSRCRHHGFPKYEWTS